VKSLKMIKAFALILSFLMSGLCYGQSAATQSLDKGVEFGAQGKFKEAKGEFEKALKIYPLNGTAKRALKVIEDVFDEKIKSETGIHIFKGIYYGEKGQLEESVAEFNKGIELNPTCAYAYNCRGITYYKKGQYDQAIIDFIKAIEINPKCGHAYANRGTANTAKGQYDQAIKDYNKAIEIDTKCIEAYYNRGITYYKNGQYYQAISDYSKAISINPQYAEAYYNRGLVYEKIGQIEKARADWKRACELGYCRGHYTAKAVYETSDFSIEEGDDV